MLPRSKYLSLAVAMLIALPTLAQHKNWAKNWAKNWDGAVKIGRPYDIDGVRYVPADDHSYKATGVASWYGDKFHGRPTSSGELYDMEELTAAHRNLPMPCFIKVTNLDNGKSVVLRVNDRGPFHSSRLVDVSRRGAETLGFISNGTARVKVERVFPNETIEQRRILAALPTPGINAPDRSDNRQSSNKMPALPAAEILALPLPPPAPEVLALAQGYDAPILAAFHVQVAALGDETRAQVLAQDISRFGAAFVEPLPGSAGQLFRVRIGPYVSADVATNMIEQLRDAGYTNAVVLLPNNSPIKDGDRMISGN